MGLLCGLLIYYLVSQFNKFVKLLILCVFNYIGNGIMLKFPAMCALGVWGCGDDITFLVVFDTWGQCLVFRNSSSYLIC